MSLIYHLAFKSDWDQARETGEYRQSTKGRTLDEVGFIHCCARASQVDQVAGAFYAGDGDLVVLIIDEAKLRSEVRSEAVPGFDTPLPHIYGPLNRDAVVAIVPLDTFRKQAAPGVAFLQDPPGPGPIPWQP